jgi:hypothetical protein
VVALHTCSGAPAGRASNHSNAGAKKAAWLGASGAGAVTGRRGAPCASAARCCACDRAGTTTGASALARACITHRQAPRAARYRRAAPLQAPGGRRTRRRGAMTKTAPSSVSHYKKRIKELERLLGRHLRLVDQLVEQRAALRQRECAARLALRQVAQLLELAALLEEQQEADGQQQVLGDAPSAAASGIIRDGELDGGGGGGGSASGGPAACPAVAPIARFRQQLLALQHELGGIISTAGPGQQHQPGQQEQGQQEQQEEADRQQQPDPDRCQQGTGPDSGSGGGDEWWRAPLGWSAHAAAARARRAAAAGELTTEGLRRAMQDFVEAASLLLP